MPAFELVSPFSPDGDQPEAIERLVEGLRQGRSFQTLMGVTGSGKTFTMAHVIAQDGRPAISPRPSRPSSKDSAPASGTRS